MANSEESLDSLKQQFDKVVNRLSMMISRTYGGELSYITVDNLPKDFITRFDDQIKSGHWSILHNSSLYCSISAEGLVKGVCVICIDKVLSEKDVLQLHTTLQLTMGSMLISSQRLETVITLEKQLEHINTQELTRLISDNNNDITRHILPAFEEEEPSTSLNLPCLIHSERLDIGRKMAFEIHNLSNRFAFVSVPDIDPECLESPKKLFELGRISLLVPNISALTRAQQCALLEYLASMPGSEGPAITALTNEPMKALKSNSDILPQLVDQLSVGLVMVNSKISKYQRNQIAQSFLSALSVDSPKPAELLL